MAHAVREVGTELFADLVVSNPHRPHGSAGLRVSLLGHAIGAALLIAVPVLWPAVPPPTRDYVLALVYDPPPPPPPPLPRGSSGNARAVRPVVTPAPARAEDAPLLTMPASTLPPPTLAPADAPDQPGSPTGSDSGTWEGMEDGVEGGVVGGVPGGVLGGVVGGTGHGAVPAPGPYDQPPRLLRQVPPEYPQEAFVKKVQGTVELEIVIDASGRVVRARVVQSIPLLDAAAIACVQQWVFAPAMHAGRPTAVAARAPIHFILK